MVSRSWVASPSSYLFRNSLCLLHNFDAKTTSINIKYTPTDRFKQGNFIRILTTKSFWNCVHNQTVARENGFFFVGYRQQNFLRLCSVALLVLSSSLSVRNRKKKTDTETQGNKTHKKRANQSRFVWLAKG